MSRFEVVPNIDIYESSRHKRIRLPKRFKVLVLKAQHGKCARCHKPLSLSVADFDHRRALEAGGSNLISNWQALHPTCHRKKTNTERRKLALKRHRRRAKSPYAFGLKLPRGF